jgi:energy-coupling factor transporter ATP-binding protein EcfA2
MADGAVASTCGFSEFSSKWRTELSHPHGGPSQRCFAVPRVCLIEPMVGSGQPDRPRQQPICVQSGWPRCHVLPKGNLGTASRQRAVAAKVLEIDPLSVEFGFVFQDSATSLNPPLRVGDCVAAPLNVDKVMREAEYTAWVAELLDAVRLPNTDARYPHELSGGQRQLATAPNTNAYRAAWSTRSPRRWYDGRSSVATRGLLSPQVLLHNRFRS